MTREEASPSTMMKVIGVELRYIVQEKTVKGETVNLRTSQPVQVFENRFDMTLRALAEEALRAISR